MQRGDRSVIVEATDLGPTGEVANKIGTYTSAFAARHAIPFYVAIPFSTLDWKLTSGLDIPIEERSPRKFSALGATKGRREHCRVANPGSGARNPGFDVTPPDLITGFITPAGISTEGPEVAKETWVC
jgi:methylthioribose-1-phosphate isomerase